jgi:hypothetical protein
MSSPIPLERLTLPVLLSSWARVVDLVARGDLPADEYAADLRIVTKLRSACGVGR